MGFRRPDRTASTFLTFPGGTTLGASGVLLSSIVSQEESLVLAMMIEATFNASATNGLTINVVPLTPEGVAATTLLPTSSIPVPSGGGATAAYLELNVKARRFQIKLTNDDTTYSITGIKVSFERVYQDEKDEN